MTGPSRGVWSPWGLPAGYRWERCAECWRCGQLELTGFYGWIGGIV